MENINTKTIFYSLLVVSILLAAFSFFYNSNFSAKNIINSNSASQAYQQKKFETITSSKNNVEFSITPLSASEFEIYINTHSVQLDFNPEEISVLHDDLGNSYKPLKWDGSPPGSHHRNGILKFPDINKNAKSITLDITDSARREFKWDLK